MAQLTVRKLDSDLVQRLRLRATRNRRSAEAEHRAILEEVLRPRSTDFWQRAEKLRQATGARVATDSSELLRKDRDRDTPDGGDLATRQPVGRGSGP